jgi:hypothetical protein
MFIGVSYKISSIIIRSFIRGEILPIFKEQVNYEAYEW